MHRPRWFTGWGLRAKLESIDWSRTALLCHHTHFDGLILTERLGFTPAFYLDTLSMARALLDPTIDAGLDEVAKFLGLGNKMPDVLSQTMSVQKLPRELSQKLGAYANVDVELTIKIFEGWYQDYPIDELRLIDLTVRAFTEPVLKVDEKLCREEIKAIQEERERIFGRATKILKSSGFEETKKILGSSPKFSQALIDLGYEVPTKPSPKVEGKRIPAFAKSDLEFQALLKCGDSKLKTLCEARLLSKSNLRHTRAHRMLLHAKPAFPVYLAYSRAHTLRWGGADKINPQNMPRCTPEPDSCRLRRALKAPRGYKMVVVDSSQIEDRTGCVFCGQTDVLDEYRRPDGDPYKAMAAKIYNLPQDQVNKGQRFLGKVARLSLMYGSGKDRFYHTIAAGLMGPPVDIDREESDKAHDVYRRTNSKITKDGWSFMNAMLGILANPKAQPYEFWWPGQDKSQDPILVFEHETVWLPNGLYLHYPQIQRHTDSGDFWYKSSRNDWTKLWGGSFLENVIQTLARIIVGEQMLRISELYRVVHMTHDEVVFLARTRQAKRALRSATEIMSQARSWYSPIPLGAEGGIANNYGDAKP